MEGGGGGGWREGSELDNIGAMVNVSNTNLHSLTYTHTHTICSRCALSLVGGAPVSPTRRRG